MHLSKFEKIICQNKRNVSVQIKQIDKCICLNLQLNMFNFGGDPSKSTYLGHPQFTSIHLFKFENVFGQINKSIYPN